MKHIAITGANGQVGFEVSLLLQRHFGIGVNAIVRSEYGSALLRRLGVACRHGSLLQPERTGELVGDCDVVADFAWPHNPIGRHREIAAQIRQTIGALRADAAYVFISTQSVFRLERDEPRWRLYGLSKRRAERIAEREGQRRGRDVVILRLGQVHGPFQRVTRKTVSGFRRDAVASLPDAQSYTVFTYSIAEALQLVAAGRLRSGTYTLFSHPEWRWTEVFDYYAALVGVAPEHTVLPVSVGGAGWLAAIRGAPRQLVRNLVQQHRQVLEYVGAQLAPEATSVQRARHYCARAATELRVADAAQHWAPFIEHLPVPGTRLTVLSDCRPFIAEVNRRLEHDVLRELADLVR